MPARILVILASLFAFLAIFTTWVDRQALDTDQWTETSGELLEDRVISDAVADYAVDQLFSNVDVAAVIEKRLPKELKPAAGPASGALRTFATTAAERAFQSNRVQGLWRDANRAAHSQMVEILTGESETVTTREGKVVLDLRPIVLQIAAQIGIENQVQERLPAEIGDLEVAESDQLDLARSIARTVEGLAWLFTIGSIALFALAAYLARGERWLILFGYGIGLVAAGLAAIALRNVASELIVDELARTEAARPPAEHAWDIGTSLLSSIAHGVIAYGVLFSLASFLASPADGAISIRHALAPALRDRRAWVWSGFGAAVFIYLIASPPTGTRQLALSVALIGLAAAGLEALMRKTAHEFPDARAGEWRLGLRQRASRAGEAAGRRIGAAVRELSSGDRHPDDARLERLERLGELKEKGILTQAEFRAEKRRILADQAMTEEVPIDPPSKRPSAGSRK